MNVDDFKPVSTSDWETEGAWVIRPRNVLLPTGEIVEDVDVFIEGDTITRVVARGESGLSDERSLLWPNGTLLPGLIDAHAHLTFSADGEAVSNAVSESAHMQVARALGNAQFALTKGITTIVDCGGRTEVMLAVRHANATGLIATPTVLVSGSPITTTDGHCHWFGGTADTTEEVIKLARKLTQDGVDFIKIMLTGGNTTAGSNPRRFQYSEETIAALGAECVLLGQPLVVHAHSEHAVQLAALAGATVVAHASCQDNDGHVGLSMLTIEALNSSGTYVDATITVGAAGADGDVDEAVLRRREQRTAMLPLFHRMHDSGVAILGGTDGGVPGVAHGQVAQAIIALHVEVGLPLGEALLSGTRRPAEAFGRGERLGSIRAGAQADLLLLDGDVLVDVSAVCRPAHVWSKGRLIASHGQLVAGPPAQAPARSS